MAQRLQCSGSVRVRLVTCLVGLLALLPTSLLAVPSKLRDRALARIAAAGQRACVVVDIDNTIADTRYRTRAAAEAYARRHPSARSLAGLPIGRVGWNGRLTALAAGLDSAAAEDFQRFWDRFFWSPRNFQHDRPMRSTIELVKAAKQAGAEVYYLTGRVNGLKRGTLRELQRLGLPDADPQHLLCKGSVGEDTRAFKRSALLALRRSGLRPAWFLSDSVVELKAVADLVSCLAVQFPVRSPTDPPLPVGLPRLRYGAR